MALAAGIAATRECCIVAELYAAIDASSFHALAIADGHCHKHVDAEKNCQY